MARKGLLVRRLDAQYSGELAQELQPLVPALDAEARLDLMRRADVWLTQEPRDAGLLLLLGRLALAQQLWGKAQGYLEASDLATALGSSSSTSTDSSSTAMKVLSVKARPSLRSASQ